MNQLPETSPIVELRHAPQHVSPGQTPHRTSTHALAEHDERGDITAFDVARPDQGGPGHVTHHGPGALIGRRRPNPWMSLRGYPSVVWTAVARPWAPAWAYRTRARSYHRRAVCCS